MKTNGWVLCAALSVPLCLTSLTLGGNVGVSDAVDQALAVATDIDSDVEPVVFHDHIRAADRNPFCFASAEALFLHVNADTGGRITLSYDDSTTVGTDISFTTGTGVDDDYGVGSRFVLGRQFSDKWGMAARYFNLEDSTTGFPRLTPGTTPLPTFGTYTETDTLQMHSIDLEAIRSFNPGKTKIDATFGARQAALDVDSLLNTFGVITSGHFANLDLSNGCAFDGTGITGALQFRRQIGESPAFLFVGGRSSKLWGHTDSFGRAEGAVASAPNPPLVGAATVTRNNAESDLVILEAQAGVQFEFALAAFPATAFFRVAGEYQDWDINGPPTGGAGFGGTIGTLTTNSFSAASLGDTELIGASVATGFTW